MLLFNHDEVGNKAKQQNTGEKIMENQKYSAYNICEKISITEIKMPVFDFIALNDLICYGAVMLAQKEFTFAKPTYDEDAGVFTDHGINEYSRTFANVYLTSLLQSAVLDSEEATHDDFQTNREICVWVRSESIPALSHLMVSINDTDFQKSIWMSKITSDYESDGHYEKISRDEFIDREIKKHILDRKRIRGILNRLDTMGRRISLKKMLKQSGISVEV